MSRDRRETHRPPRVALYEPSGRGGVCHYTYELAEHLAGAGADVTLVTTEDYELAHLPRHFRIDYAFRRSWLTRLRQGTAGPVSGGSSTRVGPPGRAPRRPALLRRMRLRWLHARAVARLRERETDVVHLQWLVDRRQDLRLIRRLRRLGIPTVYTAHDVEPHVTASSEQLGDLKNVYEAVTRVVVHSERNRAELLSQFGVDRAKVVVIPHGSFEFLSARSPESREGARRRLGLPEKRPVVLFFGLIKRYKGLEHLVEAFEIVRRAGKDAFLLVVGDIFAGDPEGYRYYRGIVDGLRGRDDARCVAEYVPVEDIGTYLAAADVVVLPYVRTYTSGVLLAAYAAGRPVIVTDTGGLPEVVEAGRTGLVVSPSDAKALAAALTKILDDPARRASMGERARELATTTYDWSAIAAKTLALYASAANPERT